MLSNTHSSWISRQKFLRKQKKMTYHPKLDEFLSRRTHRELQHMCVPISASHVIDEFSGKEECRSSFPNIFFQNSFLASYPKKRIRKKSCRFCLLTLLKILSFFHILNWIEFSAVLTWVTCVLMKKRFHTEQRVFIQRGTQAKTMRESALKLCAALPIYSTL